MGMIEIPQVRNRDLREREAGTRKDSNAKAGQQTHGRLAASTKLAGAGLPTVRMLSC